MSLFGITELVYHGIELIVGILSVAFWTYTLYKILHGYKLTFMFNEHIEGQPWLGIRVSKEKQTSGGNRTPASTMREEDG